VGAFPREFVPLSAPAIQGREWEYVKECLDTAWVSSAGQFVERFERMVSACTGARYAVATVNGTAALHVALLIAGVQPDDEVLVSTLSFIAPANAIRYVRAWPVFVDAEPVHWQMDPEKVVGFLETACEWRQGALFNKQSGRHVSAIVPVHILGHPVDMQPILEVARKYDLRVIEDATESLGAAYRGTPVGILGDVGCLSFNGNKTITTGGGGMIVTNNGSWAERAKYLTTQAKDDSIEYIHGEIGYNYRLTNLQAALGCAQLDKLDEYVRVKRRLAETYARALSPVRGVVGPREAPWAFCTFWLYTVLVQENQYGMDSRALLRKLREANIEARPLWQPLHLSPAHAGVHSRKCPVAERLNQQALSLPSSVGLTSDHQQRVLDILQGGPGPAYSDVVADRSSPTT